ncbi:hypothetical protein D3C79_695780 [compost metagenome]
MGRTLGIMVLQPLLEQRRHFQRQAQHHVGCALGTRFLGGLEQALQFAVVDHRNHRRTQDPHRHPRLAQHPDRPQPRLGRSRPRFQHPLQVVIQRRQADHHPRQALAGHLGQQVEITQYQRTLGDDGHRVPEAQEYLQQTTSQQVITLDGLVGVGIGAQVDGRADVTRLAQLLFEYFGRVGLGDQLGFEIQPWGKVPIRV